MLQHSGKVFLDVTTFSTGDIPTVYCNIMAVENEELKLIGQARFNYDKHYSKSANEIRVSFDIPLPFLNKVSPVNGGNELLKEIVISLFVFMLKDNHQLYEKVKDNLKAFMVVHSYDQDLPVMNDINAAIAHILKELGARARNCDEWILSSETFNYDYIASVNKR